MNKINKKWYHECFQVGYTIYFILFGWIFELLPQIKKVNYKRYDEIEGKKKLTKIGYCYYLFYSKYSPKGFRIPFTLIQKTAPDLNLKSSDEDSLNKGYEVNQK